LTYDIDFYAHTLTVICYDSYRTSLANMSLQMDGEGAHFVLSPLSKRRVVPDDQSFVSFDRS